MWNILTKKLNMFISPLLSLSFSLYFLRISPIRSRVFESPTIFNAVSWLQYERCRPVQTTPVYFWPHVRPSPVLRWQMTRMPNMPQPGSLFIIDSDVSCVCVCCLVQVKKRWVSSSAMIWQDIPWGLGCPSLTGPLPKIFFTASTVRWLLS